MGLAIVVLAAGRGTRYGGLKQLEPLGPAGEIVLDYTLHDAAAAGFAHAVLVVADGTVDAMAAHLDAFVPPIAVTLAVQRAERATPARTTPWGTAHATIVGADGLRAPFAVANADDAYGAHALAAVAARLRSMEGTAATASGVLVGYPVGATLSPHAGVSRAVCRVDENGRLLTIEEHTGVRRATTGIVSDTAILDESTLISMNLWGFDPSVVELLRPLVDRFVAEHESDNTELRLPDLVGELVDRGELEVTVIPTTSTWLGVTHPQDAPHVRERLAALTAAGAYPSRAVGRGSTR
jgi:dTDP-glucose pyrophosphorylase